MKRFNVIFLKEARSFLKGLDIKTREKIIFNIQKARITNNKEIFKKLKGEVWEFRALVKKKHFRIFAFWDKTNKSKTLVLTTHGIIKKTQKVPKKEIDKAERLRQEYFEQKSIRDGKTK